jgi:hypothetical protein
MNVLSNLVPDLLISRLFARLPTIELQRFYRNNFTEITKHDIMQYLSSLRKTESMDPTHKPQSVHKCINDLGFCRLVEVELATGF